MSEQLNLFESEPNPNPFAAKTVTVYFLKDDRLPKLFKREQCSKTRAKALGMEMLTDAARWGGYTPKPSKWREGMAGVLYATADASQGRFKVEITNTDETNQ